MDPLKRAEQMQSSSSLKNSNETFQESNEFEVEQILKKRRRNGKVVESIIFLRKMFWLISICMH